MILTTHVFLSLTIRDNGANSQTVFQTPLPNPQLWNGSTIGFLQMYECFVNGGWWHDPSILSATGDGIDTEEARGWRGWWNEQVV